MIKEVKQVPSNMTKVCDQYILVHILKTLLVNINCFSLTQMYFLYNHILNDTIIGVIVSSRIVKDMPQTPMETYICEESESESENICLTIIHIYSGL